jgi:antitoxin component YwqK of YwqJK toxin-antitoxin module
MQFNKKQDYWFFYNENGFKKEEGHYENDKKVAWWIFYSSKNKIIKKSEYSNDKLNGFSIIYDNGEIIKAEKYNQGKKIKEWESIAEFKKDNTDLL